MRAYLAATMLSIGGMFISFAAVVFVIEIFTRRNDTGHSVPTESALGIEMLVGGAVLMVIGYLLSRMGSRRSNESAGAR
jgi:hypothetical protein